jgi:hypothetical protein
MPLMSRLTPSLNYVEVMPYFVDIPMPRHSNLLDNHVRWSERGDHVYIYNIHGYSGDEESKLSWVICMAQFDAGPFHRINAFRNKEEFHAMHGGENLRSQNSLSDVEYQRTKEFLHMMNAGDPQICMAYRVERGISLPDLRYLALRDICPVHPAGREIARAMMSDRPTTLIEGL